MQRLQDRWEGMPQTSHDGAVSKVYQHAIEDSESGATVRDVLGMPRDYQRAIWWEPLESERQIFGGRVLGS